MRGKTVALLVLLILIGGAVYATSVQTTFVLSNQPVSLMEFVSNMMRTVVGLCDPVPGGGSSGGY